MNRQYCCYFLSYYPFFLQKWRKLKNREKYAFIISFLTILYYKNSVCVFVYKHFDWTKDSIQFLKEKKSESLFPTLLLPVFREKWFLTFFLKKNKNKTLLLFLPIYTRCIVCHVVKKTTTKQQQHKRTTTTNLRFECNNDFFIYLTNQCCCCFCW